MIRGNNKAQAKRIEVAEIRFLSTVADVVLEILGEAKTFVRTTILDSIDRCRKQPDGTSSKQDGPPKA